MNTLKQIDYNLIQINLTLNAIIAFVFSSNRSERPLYFKHSEGKKRREKKMSWELLVVRKTSGLFRLSLPL